MAALGRAAIMAAIFAKLSSVPGFVTRERRFRDLARVSAAEQPYLTLLGSDKQDAAYKQEGAPAVWTLEPTIFVYARTEDPNTAPADVLDPLVDGIEAALQWVAGDSSPTIGAPTTLGGRVTHCRISSVAIGEGAESGQAVAIIHLHVSAAGK